MVSHRCKMMVDAELNKLGIKHFSADLGTVEIVGEVSRSQLDDLRRNLLRSGLELLDDRKSIFIERIKNAIVTMIHDSDEFPVQNYSEILSEKLGYDYTYLSNTFSEVTGITIQHFIIIHKIEK